MKNKQKKQPLDCHGFTLVEVLAGFLILLMASQILLFGISFAGTMRTKSEAMEMVRRDIGEHLMEKTDCISGTVRLEIGHGFEDIESTGWLYDGNEDRKMKIIWVEEAIPETSGKTEREPSEVLE